MAFLRILRRFLSLALVTSVALTLLLVHVVPRVAPQDLPWTPLDLDAPIGSATAGKIAALDGPACRVLLDPKAWAYRPLPDTRHGACGGNDIVVPLNARRRQISYIPSAPSLACPLAVALMLWEREVVEPAAARWFGTGIAAIDHYGSYACRRLYGRTSGDWSEHASARAIDIAGFRLSDRRRISVARGWRRSGAEGKFLHEVRDGACRLFATTLSPDYNKAHWDHLHLDEARRGAWWRVCR